MEYSEVKINRLAHSLDVLIESCSSPWHGYRELLINLDVAIESCSSPWCGYRELLINLDMAIESCSSTLWRGYRELLIALMWLSRVSLFSSMKQRRDDMQDYFYSKPEEVDSIFFFKFCTDVPSSSTDLNWTLDNAECIWVAPRQLHSGNHSFEDQSSYQPDEHVALAYFLTVR